MIFTDVVKRNAKILLSTRIKYVIKKIRQKT